MLKQTLQSIHLTRLAAAIALTVLAADFLPHPNLGPSLIQQSLSALIQPATAAD